jgi:hypothetical protein
MLINESTFSSGCCYMTQVSGELVISDDMTDADTEEALAEFDFLVSTHRDGAVEARTRGEPGSTDWGECSRITCAIASGCDMNYSLKKNCTS